jgi:hypothetical protein
LRIGENRLFSRCGAEGKLWLMSHMAAHRKRRGYAVPVVAAVRPEQVKLEGGGRCWFVWVERVAGVLLQVEKAEPHDSPSQESRPCV